MNENYFNIEHLLKVELDAQDNLENYPYEDKLNITRLLNPTREENICTFDPNKNSNKFDYSESNRPEVYDSLNKSLQEIEEDKKSIILCSIKQFKKQLVEMIVIINNFFDNFTNELDRDNNIDEVYKNYILSIDQIKQSMEEIFHNAEATSTKEPLKIETLESGIRSIKFDNSIKQSPEFFGSNPAINTNSYNYNSTSKYTDYKNYLDKDKLTVSKLLCDTPKNLNDSNKFSCKDSCTVNYVIDKLVSEYKEQNLELKNEMNKLKNKTFLYERLILSSKKLIEEIYSKNKKLKEKLIKYKLSK